MTIESRPIYGQSIGRVVDANGQPTGHRVILLDVFEKFLDDLIGLLGGTTASVRTMEGITSYLSAQLLNRPEPVVTGADYECAGQERVVVVTAGARIKLPDAPGRDQNIKVIKATADDVTVDGNGKAIVGDTEVLFNSDIYSALNLTYVLDRDEWFIT